VLTDAAILVSALLVGAVLATPRVARSPGWRATVTPLASIIGSGFLILGPILDLSFGIWAPLAMLGLCALAWAFGAAVRQNIIEIESAGRSRGEELAETAASWVLAFAYVISVAYYLNLFGAFAVELTPWPGPLAGRVVTTAVFGVILFLGAWRGFAALEHAEELAVSVKLAIIAGLLAGLVLAVSAAATSGGLHVNPPTEHGLGMLTLMMGLIVTVQGFETARYLGATYDARTRIAAMVRAQVISTLIYVVYVSLLVVLFPPERLTVSETAIIGLMRSVSGLLPFLLVFAALAAQFSAAVADTGGSGGLVRELSAGRIPTRRAYALVVGAGVTMTWALNVFQIIAYASRAFALYYALQSLIAALASARRGAGLRAAGFAGLALLGLAITLFGRAVEA
jgi:hypothetical protein